MVAVYFCRWFVRGGGWGPFRGTEGAACHLITLITSNTSHLDHEIRFAITPKAILNAKPNSISRTLSTSFRSSSSHKMKVTSQALALISAILLNTSSAFTSVHHHRASTSSSSLKVANDLFVEMTSETGAAAAAGTANTHSSVETYYGDTLKESADLLTNACCTAARPAPQIAKAISNIHPDVIKKYYGCGFCVPDEVEGMTILDLGCGAGRDV